MHVIFISTFPEKSDEFCTVSAKEILLTCIIQKISKGFHPYQSSLVNKGFNYAARLGLFFLLQ